MNKDYVQGDRPDARNILVVLTSGRLGDEVEKPIEVSYDENTFAELLTFGIVYLRFTTSCNLFFSNFSESFRFHRSLFYALQAHIARKRISSHSRVRVVNSELDLYPFLNDKREIAG